MGARSIIAMMRRRLETPPPPIYADLVLEIDGQTTVIDVEIPRWLDDVRPLYKKAMRVGLKMRKRRKPSVWLAVNGAEPEYLSRVIGQFDDMGHRRIRVAGLICGDTAVWLHRDGVVEVQEQPSWR